MKISVEHKPDHQQPLTDSPRQRKTAGHASEQIHQSPRQLMQRQRMVAMVGDALQRVELEDDEPLQGKFASPDTAVQRQEGEAAAPRENRTGMPDQLKTNMEVMSGFDLSEVRVHRNSDKPAQLNALAYAQGNEIHLGPGQEQHLPHEAWHVVQQKQGRVKATMQVAGMDMNDDERLENEADERGNSASSVARNGTAVAVGSCDSDPVADGYSPPIQAFLKKDDNEPNAEEWTAAKGWAIARCMIDDQENGFTKSQIMEKVQIERDLRATNICHKALAAVISERGAEGPMSTEELAAAMLEKDDSASEAMSFLREEETYSISTIANAKAHGLIGHHVFIQYEDATVSEWAWPETKASYPKSQSEVRRASRATVANIRMSARKHGGPGREGRYFKWNDNVDTRASFQGYLYFPWYQDCFSWVDAVLAEAGEPKNTSIVRISEGAVALWGGISVLLVAAGGWFVLSRKG